MKYIKLTYGLLLSNVKMAIQKVFHIRSLQYHPMNYISIFSMIRLQNRTSYVSFGKMVQIRSNVEINANGGHICIGNNVFVNRNSIIASHDRITIGDGTTIGPNVCIYDHDHDYKKSAGGYITSPIIIGKNVWIGAGSIILKGVTIGDEAVVAAGAVVIQDVPSNSIAAGVPAKVIKNN